MLKSIYRVSIPTTQAQFSLLRVLSSQVKCPTKVNFNTKHLQKGDPLPPYNGKLRVYSSRYCPFAQRTLLALIAKDLDFEVVNVNLMSKPEWLVTKSPLEKVPVLEIEERVCLAESLITVEYLDEVYPKRSLLPTDPVRKADDKFIIEFSSMIGTLFIKIGKKPESITETTISNFQNALTFIEKQLKIRGSKFLHGDEPGYVDYMTWPWFERAWALQDTDRRINIDKQKYATLVSYIENMLQDPVVLTYIVPRNIHLEHMEGYKHGNTPNYDLLLQNDQT